MTTETAEHVHEIVQDDFLDGILDLAYDRRYLTDCELCEGPLLTGLGRAIFRILGLAHDLDVEEHAHEQGEARA